MTNILVGECYVLSYILYKTCWFDVKK